MRQITKDLNNLKENDIINILLYGIYKLTDSPEYAILSELMYTIDKDSLLRLCSTFGGCTIRIPTIFEFEKLTRVLLLIQCVNKDGMTFDEACEFTELDKFEKKDIVNLYNILSEVIEEYTNEQNK